MGKGKKIPLGWISTFVIIAGLVGAYYGFDGYKWIKKIPLPKLSFFIRDYPLTTDYLPASVSYFGSLSVSDLALKAEAYEFEDLRIFNDLLKEIKGESREAYEKIQSLKNDGENEFGVDFYDDIVFAGTNLRRDENYSLIGFSIADNEIFEEFIKDLLDDNNVSVRKKYKDDYSMFSAREFAITWNDDVGFIVIAQDNDSQESFENICKDIFNQDEEGCLTKNEYFQSFYKEKGDFSFYADFQSLSESDKIKDVKDEFEDDPGLKSVYKSYPSMPSVDEIMENVKIIFDISFTEEKMAVKLKADVTGALADFINENSPYGEGVSQGMVEMLPPSVLAGAFSLDESKFAEYTAKGIELLKEESPKSDEALLAPFESFTGYSPTEITSYLKGGCIGSFYDIKPIEVEYLEYEEVWDDSANTVEDVWTGDTAYSGGLVYDYVKHTKEIDLPAVVVMFDVAEDFEPVFTTIMEAWKIENLKEYIALNDQVVEPASEDPWGTEAAKQESSDELVQMRILDLLSVCSQAFEIEKGSSGYKVGIENYIYHVDVIDNVLVITNDQSLLGDISKNKGGASNSAMITALTSNIMSFYGSLDKKDQSANMKTKAKDLINEFDRKEKEIYNRIIGRYKSVTLEMSNASEFEFSIHLKNPGDENALNLLIQDINDSYVEMKK